MTGSSWYFLLEVTFYYRLIMESFEWKVVERVTILNCDGAMTDLNHLLIAWLHVFVSCDGTWLLFLIHMFDGDSPSHGNQSADHIDNTILDCNFFVTVTLQPIPTEWNLLHSISQIKLMIVYDYYYYLSVEWLSCFGCSSDSGCFDPETHQILVYQSVSDKRLIYVLHRLGLGLTFDRLER